MRTDNDGRFRLPSVRHGRYAVALSGVPDAPHSVPEPPANRTRGRTANSSRQRSSAAAEDVGRNLTWVEASECAEEDATIEFR